MQQLFYGDYDNTRRRVYLWLVGTDGITPPSPAETGGQPQLSKNGATPANTTNPLAAVDTAKGQYYVELTLAESQFLGKGKVIYKGSGTAVEAEDIEVVPLPYLHDGTAQGGASGSITLASGASATNDLYNDAYVLVIKGTGAGQGARQITGYNGTSKVATVDQAWLVTPDNTSVYVVLPGAKNTDLGTAWDATSSSHQLAGTFGQAMAPIRTGTAQAGAASTITLDSGASATDDFYNYLLLRIVSGVGAGQARYVTDYIGASKIATVNRPWVVQPDNTSVFVLRAEDAIPGASAPTAEQNAQATWDLLRPATPVPGSFGEGVTIADLALAAIADRLLLRNIGAGSDGGLTVKFVMCFMAGKWTRNGNVITVYDIDDVTQLGTITLDLAGASLIGGINSATS